MFHKALTGIILAVKPSNTLPTGYSEYYVAWRGNTPLLYPPSPLISHRLPTLKSLQKMVNWSLVEHGLEVTKHLRHPHLGTKNDMGWYCPLLGFYCRVRSRSYQGHFKVKPDIILNKRPRGLDACQQHCKISATDVSENVYLCSKINYHEKEICIGLYTQYYVFISYSSYPYYMFDSHHLLILHTFYSTALNEKCLTKNHFTGLQCNTKVEMQLLFILGLSTGPTPFVIVVIL